MAGQYNDGIGTVMTAGAGTMTMTAATAVAVAVGAVALPDWKEDDCLCQNCFKSFLIENLWVWLRQVKANCMCSFPCPFLLVLSSPVVSRLTPF